MVRNIGPAPVPTGPLLSPKDLFDENSLHQVLSTLGHAPHRGRSNDDNEDSTVTTILSAHSESSHDYDDDAKRSSEKQDGVNSNGSRLSLASKWSRLQQAFDCRDRMLDRLSRTQNPGLMRVIRKREFVVRQQERELLLLQHAQEEHDTASQWTPESSTADNKAEGHIPQTGSSSRDKQNDEDDSDKGIDDDDDDDDTSDSIIWYEARQILEEKLLLISASHQTIPLTATTSTSKPENCFHHFYDMLLCEWNIGAPAIMSLFFHTLAHASIYDIVEICVEEFKKCAELYTYFPATCTCTNAFVFFVGISMMRLSGSLYWWLNDVDFKTIKFDMHNRLRLGFMDARYMLWVKRLPLFQALASFIGYCLCHKVIFDLYEKFYHVFFQQEDVLSELLPRSSSVAEVIGGLEEERNEDVVLGMDYLQQVLDLQFLSGWGFDEEMGPLLMGPQAGAIFCAICFVISIFILRCYGFGFFEKY